VDMVWALERLPDVRRLVALLARRADGPVQ
jgi:hypothetical protein